MRLYIKILLVFCFSGLGSPWIKAQPTLETLLHLDKSFYVSGEVVWFKLYLPSTWEGTDVAINTAIIDEQQVTIDQFFIKSAGRSFADGYFQIPYNQSSGFLEIQFSASSDPQKPEEILAYYSFPIYNDLNVPSDIEIADNVDAKSDPTLFNEEISIDLNLASDQVNIRDQVGLSLTIKDKDGQPLSGHASLSVKDAHLSQINIGENTIKTLVLSPTVMQADLKSSVYCRGMLSNPDGTPLQMNVLGGYVGDAQHIYYSKSFDNGNYQIDLPDFTGKKGIQLIGFQYEHPDLRSEVVTPKLLGNHQKIIYTKDIIEYLE
ncbi:MAG: hypothetical protein KDC53_11005, partial [Saprospiraceae bacterium]|nr:hypothetical protein [Saprospiraceae bacterium]